MTTTSALPHDCPAPHPNTIFGQRVRAVVRRAADDIRARVGIAALFLLAASTAIFANGDNACHCAVTATDAPLVEWDLPVPTDFGNGAITVDSHPQGHRSRLWFVNNAGTPPRLFRFEVGKNLPTSNATWKSFDLSMDGGFFTGGLHRIKVHKNDRWVFVRADGSLQRIDTGNCSVMQTCQRITWLDQPAGMTVHVSDLSVDDDSLNGHDSCNVYTTAAVFDDVTGAFSPDSSYLQGLSCENATTSSDGMSGTTQVKRWKVGGGAGFCAMALESTPCLSGVFVDPKHKNLVYFSEPDANVIGQLNTSNNIVKRWSLSGLEGVTEPRQLEIDDDGMVWVVTGSGHLVRLDPRYNRLSKHMMPEGASADPFGVAPDHGIIGFTQTAQDSSRVGMLVPSSTMVTVPPTSECIPPALVSVTFTVEQAMMMSGSTPAQPKMAIAHTTPTPDGTFVEAQVGGGDSGNGSFKPRGITPDPGRRLGSFFYAVEMNTDTALPRVGHIQLPFPRKDHRFGRDDDDNDGVHHGNGDDDDDGVKDGDDHDSHETRDRHDNEQVGAGQSTDYTMDADANTTLMTAILTAADLGQMVAIEVYNPAGQLVASPLPAPGTAAVSLPPLTTGTYIVRVKNLGIVPTTFTTTLITAAAWPLLPDLP